MGANQGKFGELNVWSEAHARPYDFTPFEAVGKDFVRILAQEFKIKCETTEWAASSASSTFSDMSSFLSFLLRYPSGSALRQKLAENCANDKKDWNTAILSWRSEIAENPDLKARSKDNKVSRFRPFMKRLADKGVIPQLGDVVRGFDYDSSPKRSLAQVTNGAISDAELKVRLRKVRLGVEKTEIPGALAYFTALASESDSISDKPIPDQVLELLDKRLSNLRKCAEKDLLEQYRLFKHGQDLIKMCDVSLREIEQRIELGSGKRTLIDNVFTPGDKGLSRLLCYYKGAHGGCRPGEGYEVNGRWLGKELGEIEREYGGAESVLRWLGHGRRLLTCVSVITMVDQALNVESARTLKRDCLGPVESGMRRFRWTKCRSGKKSKDQSEMFPVKDGLHEVSLVKAVQIALECTESLAAKAGAEGARFKNYLLLSNSGTTRNSYTSEDVRLGANDTFLNQIRKFASEHEELAGFADELTQDQIRPSVLLHVALQTQSIIAVQRKGKHRSSKTSFLYAHKLPTQIAGNANIQSFMQHLQVLSSWNIEGMAEKTGIPKDRFDALRASLSDVGLGVFCQDPKAGEQASQGYGEGEMCGAIDKCPGCPKRSDYIFATPENIANLICWKDHLEKERDIRMAENPDRWLSIWEPWVVFVEVALEKLSASRQFMKIYKSGEVLAASSNASYPECT